MPHVHRRVRGAEFGPGAGAFRSGIVRSVPGGVALTCGFRTFRTRICALTMARKAAARPADGPRAARARPGRGDGRGQLPEPGVSGNSVAPGGQAGDARRVAALEVWDDSPVPWWSQLRRRLLDDPGVW